ncbi:hypothetical protein ACXGQW_06650 [Wenyingzhuangia sp. IMCC45533]
MLKSKFYIKFFIVSVLFWTGGSIAQIRDLVKVDFTNLISENSKFSFTRNRFSVNYPFKLNDKNYLISGINYNRIDAKINIDGLSENFNSDVTQFRQYEFNMAFIHQLSSTKKIIAQFKPGLSSNFSSNKIFKEDFVVTVGLGIIIDKRKEAIEKPYRLILGAAFSGTSGVPFPLPFISYYRKLSERREFTLGIPKINYKFLFREGKSKLGLLARLEGFNSSIQDNVSHNNNRVNRLRATLIVGGLGYEHFFTKHIIFYSAFDRVLIDRVRLNFDNDEIKKIETSKDYFFKVGIKFKI